MILAVVMMVVLPLVMAALLVLPPLRPVIVRALGLAPLPACDRIGKEYLSCHRVQAPLIFRRQTIHQRAVGRGQGRIGGAAGPKAG